ncbi:MAG: hypothetical protein PHF74_05765 [Dehalococcoidales bacterium]|nr:hypothetical protein [Dehalococcoidales bacterium]
MRNKKSALLFIIVLLLPVLSLNISCSSNNDTVATADNSALTGFLLNLGYENCLMCHSSDDKNAGKNLNFHCLHFDPMSYSKIVREDYSPTLSDCLVCHKSHLEKGGKTIYDCGKCHLG